MESTDPAPQQQPAPADQPKPGGCLRKLAGLALLLVLLAVLGAIVAHRMIVVPVTSSEPYQMALQAVQNDPQVVELLGEPIEQVFWPPPSGANLEGGQSRATLNFEVAGPKGKASVLAEARMLAKAWGLIVVRVTISESGQQINVDTAPASGLEEAPKFKPGG